jgi:DNA-binding beta-propeller fold protein YncE
VLAAVERELADEPVVVIGVHSPKFPAEGDAALVRDAVRRHGVGHPVVVDTGHDMWSQYGIRAWPTLVIVGADGVIVGASSGEPDVGPLLATLRGVLDAQADLLVRAPLPLRVEPPPPGALAFPGGLAVGDDGGIWVADTGHHQVVELAPDGAERRRIGSGRPRLADGVPDEAAFAHPHGLALAGGRLVVADTGNHAVRAVDVATGAVTTLAGTGRRGRSLDPAGTAGPARGLDLRSPWDVAIHPDGEAVLVAMAGSHQLWGVQDGIAAVVAGSGREARVDGDAATAAFAQPSGLAWGPAVGGRPALYVADSEISAVRRVVDGQVATVAGGDLYDFGLADGDGDAARFQHPVGIAAGPGGALLVADTLNHAVRLLDPGTGSVRTLLGDGTPLDAAHAALERRATVPADARSAALCREPEAVAWDGARVLVADTGNHRVLAVDPATGAAAVLAGSG